MMSGPHPGPATIDPPNARGGESGFETAEAELRAFVGISSVAFLLSLAFGVPFA